MKEKPDLKSVGFEVAARGGWRMGRHTKLSRSRDGWEGMMLAQFRFRIGANQWRLKI